MPLLYSRLFVGALFRYGTLLIRFRCFGLSVLMAGFVTTLALAAEDPHSLHAERWADHPALQGFAIAGQELPRELFLVRTRGKLPAAAGVVVHDVQNGVYLVSGDPVAVMALAHYGCAVFSLESLPAAPRSAPRQWVWRDAPDPDIQSMVAQVDWIGISDKIQWLVDFGSRYSFLENHYEVADAIGGVFSGYGLQPVLRSFVYRGNTMWNVEATQTGTVYPDSFFIICGHFDSISDMPQTLAPGADDNGTGVAAVLTAAEILIEHDFEYSIRYICFGGEEQGLRGSQAYADWAVQNNLGIVGVLNFDMMGYWISGVEMDLEIETNHASQWLAAAIINAAELYTSAPYELHVDDGAWWGDHASFWGVGYAAVNHEEAWDWGDPDFNPYYHTTNDLLVHVDPGFTVGNIKIGVAALATLTGLVPGATGADDPAKPPSIAANLIAYPNPFSGRVNFAVAGLPDRDGVSIIIYDASGRRVDAVPVVLHNGRGAAFWNIIKGEAPEIGAGVYFGRLEGLPAVAPVKIVYIK